MSDDERERVREQIDQSAETENGLTRVMLAEGAVRAADGVGDEELRYDARMELLEATIFGGYPEKALVAFSWIAAACDRNPALFPESSSMFGLFLTQIDLLWAYKWVVQNTHGFPQITRTQIEETLDDMELRYRKNHVSLRPVWMNRTRIAHALDGPGPDAAAYFANWEDAPRDLYADCAACEQHFKVDYHLHRGAIDDALAAAAPLLDGQLSCAEVPHITFVNLVIPLAERGEHERATQYFERGYEMCRDNRDFLEVLAELLEYAVWQDELETATSIFRNHARWLQDSRVGFRRMRWLIASAELFERIDANDEAANLVAEFAAPLGLPSKSAREFSTKLRREADELAAAFDRRNGNTIVSDNVATVRARMRSSPPE